MSIYAESLRHYLKPVVEFLDDATVTEILINGADDIWIERRGRLLKTEATFHPEVLEAAARNMAQYVGRVLDDERPQLDARLPDGSRIHVVMPPVSRQGCTISIRKFFPEKLGVEDLVGFDTLTPPMAKLIDACVNIKLNIMISGGTGSGKTTLLNCLGSYISDDERILTIEESAELQLDQAHLVALEARTADKFGKGRVDMGALLNSALRLRPDRIVVGEVRGGEAFHLMQAMNTGHGGSLATVHANTPVDTLRRLESLCLQGGVEIPMMAVRSQVAAAIDLVVVCSRMNDGTRKITHISEVLPLDERGEYRSQDLFVFTQTHKGEDGTVHGFFGPTGLLPTFSPRLAPAGYGYIEETFFDPATYDVPPPPVVGVAGGYEPRWAPTLRHRETGEPDPVDPAEQLDAWVRDYEARAEIAVPGPNVPGAAVKPAGSKAFEEQAVSDARGAAAKESDGEPDWGDTDPRISAGELERTEPGIALEDEPAATDPGFDPRSIAAKESDGTAPGAEPKARADLVDAAGEEDQVGAPSAEESPAPDIAAAAETAQAGEPRGDAGDVRPERTAPGLSIDIEVDEDEPTIQLDADFAAEAALHPESDRPSPASGEEGPESPAPRRRKGGVIGRS